MRKRDMAKMEKKILQICITVKIIIANIYMPHESV